MRLPNKDLKIVEKQGSSIGIMLATGWTKTANQDTYEHSTPSILPNFHHQRKKGFKNV